MTIDEIIPTIRAWLSRLIRRRADALPVVPVVVADPPPAMAPPQPEKKRRKTQERPDAETFAELLEALDDVSETLSMPAVKGNWLTKAETLAIRKMGVYVPTPWVIEHVPDPRIAPGFKFPAMASASMIPKKLDTKRRLHPRFMFAIKQPRLPAQVQQIKGIVYKFGLCFTLEGKTLWSWAYIVVTPSGSIVFPSERRTTYSTIRSKTDGVQHVAHTAWRAPVILTDGETPKDQAEEIMRQAFRNLLMWWTTRDTRWSVGVRKGDTRLTFSIAQEHTAAYFADREKSVTVNGATKRIIHFVREHERANGAVVKAHVRGLRDFMWNGYRCLVTAPKLNGQIFTDAPLVPVIVKKRDYSPQKFDTTEGLAERLADAEDFGIR